MLNLNDTKKECDFREYNQPPSKDLVVQLVLSSLLGVTALIAFCVSSPPICHYPANGFPSLVEAASIQTKAEHMETDSTVCRYYVRDGPPSTPRERSASIQP